MTLLRLSVRGFTEEARNPSLLEQHLAELLRFRTARSPSPAEGRSWRRSLPVLAKDLEDAGLDRIEVLIEHQLPLTSKRADVVLAGRHPRTREPSYVVIELKQWSRTSSWQDDPELVLIDGYPHAPRLNPIVQVRSYCEYLVDFTRALHDLRDPVAGASYLHNVTREADIASLREVAEDAHGRLFTSVDRSEFLDFLRRRLDPADSGTEAADILLKSAIAPSRQLLTVAADEVQRRERFVLLDEQRVALRMVLNEVERTRAADTKSVVVVTGGPGSGKSVIALSMLGELARRGRPVLHATGSRSFTKTLRRVAGHRVPRVQRLFKYFNQFIDAEPNGLDVLILDEAHRIRETSVDRFTPVQHRTGRPQVDELFAAARVPVFLLDQHQVVRPGEMGTVEQIRDHAQRAGLTVREIALDAQFRCGGSEEFVRWVQALLGLSGEPPFAWSGDPVFEVDLVDSPAELEAVLSAKQKDGYGARMTAGYCWRWSDPRPDGSLVADVTVEAWSRPWNVKGDRAVGGAPPAALWATEPTGFGQVGCVYTAQGFEYDWNGVILGPDLVWRDGGLVSRREHNKDPNFRNTSLVSDADFDRLVRNVYKVLLTRGMVGTLLYSIDSETRSALEQLLPVRVEQSVPAQ